MSEKYISRSPAVAMRRLGDETIVMSAADSSIFALNDTATAIWEAADGRTTLREIVERRVCEEFDTDSETAYRDAEELVADLAGHGILVVSDRPAD